MFKKGIVIKIEYISYISSWPGMGKERANSVTRSPKDLMLAWVSWSL